jgi:hypothetical protein
VQQTPPQNVGSGNPTGGSGDLAHVWLYVAKPSATSSKTDICVRVQGGSNTNAGGRLELDTAGSLGVTPANPVGTDMNGCTVPGPHSDDGTTWRIDTSQIVPTPANPFSVCVTVQGSTTRITVGTSSSTPSPFIQWFPDLDTPVPYIHIP